MTAPGNDGTPVVGVLALQGDVREHLIALATADAVAREVRRPEELAEVDGLVIPGGESTTISKLAHLFGLMEPLRARVREGMPVYGTCAGLIMLADKILDPRSGQETVGGIDMIVRRNAFGRQNESFEAAVDVRGVAGDPVEGVFIRAPWVESVGASVEVLAEHDGHIVAVRQGSALATSFHPELTGDHRLHALFVDMVREKAAAGSL
ncbi:MULTISPECIES: pyridoxal 5'-phosphate synthase glutaminase subunit PdxT [unclassified Streptomyces]|uniref:pyridoxal 5'-phosphate synthase glutaminase subunit PdxT n=1 Tax=unclassified Streptomyces TaxID=2593676 RepID=UPI000DBA085E|nr:MULTISPECIES: pyridoxal 5'-phosphate synthase glutaminase subunit PdxT [unclassified Streptomyces]MYT69364.1 pyridoxal 5'-phosphate synthase glutaminase subunit PdxT [Streptomyces sp. SID8367]RAJ79750.1 pyridoxal phosphate synthase yaaE subunit [Streptomyces sp. PsTaAH-137]